MEYLVRRERREAYTPLGSPSDDSRTGHPPHLPVNSTSRVDWRPMTLLQLAQASN